MSTQSLQFRLANPEDAEQLQDLIHAAFRAEDSRPNWTADMELGAAFSIKLEDLQTRIGKPDSGFIIASNEQNPFVATIGVSRIAPDYARLALLAVDPRHQQGGTGRQVLAYAEDYCNREWGVSKIGLNALSTRQELLSWYMRRGYEKTGETTSFPQHGGDDLHFVEMLKQKTSA